jgi:peptide/histidine transporter 3/4
MLAVMGLSVPLAGWLADVRFGRYKVLSCSLWIMWISAMLSTAALVVIEVVSFKYNNILLIALLVPEGIGYGLFQVTIIQFGIDQLTDSSTTQFKSFVAWYSWTFIAGGQIVYYLLTCIEYKLFTPLLICGNLTLAVTLHLIFNHHLVKEPKTQNPFKLIYKVISHAIRHKHPRQRSAFTYCEEDIPSRIDLAKSKYGGPFTVEQVEDVKTLLRIIPILLIGSALYSISDEGHSLKSKIISLFKNDAGNQPLEECSSQFIITGSYFICGTLLIPFHELIIHPVFYRCLPKANSSHKFMTGVILRLGKLIAQLTVVTVSRKYYVQLSNGTLPCLLYESPQVSGTHVNYTWNIFPEVFCVASDLLMYIGTLEFLCAQVPYSMKGLVTGTVYALLGLYISAFSELQRFYTTNSTHWGNGVISCEFWFFATKIAMLTVGIFIFCVILKCYKNRKREDVLPNEQIFAERYYSN